MLQEVGPLGLSCPWKGSLVNRIFRVGDVSLTRNDQTELHIFKSRRSNIFRDGMGWSANLDLPPGEEVNIFQHMLIFFRM